MGFLDPTTHILSLGVSEPPALRGQVAPCRWGCGERSVLPSQQGLGSGLPAPNVSLVVDLAAAGLWRPLYLGPHLGKIRAPLPPREVPGCASSFPPCDRSLLPQGGPTSLLPLPPPSLPPPSPAPPRGTLPRAKHLQMWLRMKGLVCDTLEPSVNLSPSHLYVSAVWTWCPGGGGLLHFALLSSPPHQA